MIGVIGCGNMASAIVKGISKKYPETNFLTYTPSFTRADDLAKAVNGKAVKNLKELSGVKKLIIACKPQQFNDLAINLSKEFDLSNIHIISIMAAISVETIQSKLHAPKVTRIMPNTPVEFGLGISLFYHSNKNSSEENDYIENLFSATSSCYRLETEELFDKVTVVSGSGPAYVFYFTQLLSENLVKFGLNSSDSTKMAIELLKGSVQLMENRGDDSLSQLVDKVTSKKGVTIEAMDSFKESQLDQIMQKALGRATKRSLEITSEFSK